MPLSPVVTRDADRPSKPARAQGLTELGAHAVPGVGEDRTVANAGGDQAIEFCKRKLRLGPRPAIFGGHASAREPTPGRTSRQYPYERRLAGDERERRYTSVFAPRSALWVTNPFR